MVSSLNLTPATSLKKRLQRRCFAVNFAKKNIFFIENLWSLFLFRKIVEHNRQIIPFPGDLEYISEIKKDLLTFAYFCKKQISEDLDSFLIFAFYKIKPDKLAIS